MVLLVNKVLSNVTTGKYVLTDKTCRLLSGFPNASCYINDCAKNRKYPKASSLRL